MHYRFDKVSTLNGVLRIIRLPSGFGVASCSVSLTLWSRPLRSRCRPSPSCLATARAGLPPRAAEDDGSWPWSPRETPPRCWARWKGRALPAGWSLLWTTVERGRDYVLRWYRKKKVGGDTRRNVYSCRWMRHAHTRWEATAYTHSHQEARPSDPFLLAQCPDKALEDNGNTVSALITAHPQPTLTYKHKLTFIYQLYQSTSEQKDMLLKAAKTNQTDYSRNISTTQLS